MDGMMKDFIISLVDRLCFLNNTLANRQVHAIFSITITLLV